MGDEKAITIIDNNAKALAELLNIGVDLYKARPFAIASGGIFENFGEIFVPHINKYSKVQLRINGLPPVYGACRCALAMSGKEAPNEFQGNFKKSYRCIK